MIQTVLELDLNRHPSNHRGIYDAHQFERYNVDQIERLAPGSYVRLRVGNYPPLMYHNREWFRADLMWQIIASDAYVLEEWRQYMEGVPIAQY